MKLTKKVSRDWYLEDLIGAGFPLEYWDVVNLVSEEYSDSNILKKNYLRKIKSYSELEDLIVKNSNQNVIYILLLNYKIFSIDIYKLLTKYNSLTVFFNWGALPVKSYSLYRTALKYKHLKIHNLIYKIYGKFIEVTYSKLKLINPYTISFNAGSESLKTPINATKKIPFNLCDYDQFLHARARTRKLIKKKYAVFLDINLPTQRDLDLEKLQKIDPVSYFNSLNNFFEKIEEKYDLEVIIALHPKSSYSKKIFLDRKVTQLNTAELVKNAHFVITHYSTSVSYAVLFKKPIMFIYTEEMLNAYKYNIIEEINCMARYFDLKSINIDNFSDSEIILKKINKDKYIDYKYKYLTSKSTEFIPNIKIIIREFKKLQS